MPPDHGGKWWVLMWLRKKTSAECRKMTVSQGIFRSEGTREGRGQQQHQYPPVAAARSRNLSHPINTKLAHARSAG
jgi:hypothetical protein